MRELDTYEDLEELDEIFGDLNLTMLHSDEKHRVFVYGTLMSGMRNHHRLVDGNARLIDASAHMLGTVSMQSRETSRGYLAPIVIKEPAHKPLVCVEGEVYEVSSKLLSTLDAIEGHPEIYEREKNFVFTTSKIKEMWMYYYVAKIPQKFLQEGITATENEDSGIYHYKWSGL